MSWTDEAVDILRAGHRRGHSFSEIASELQAKGYNVTRNGAIGKARRIGLDDRAPGRPIGKTNQHSRRRNVERVIVRQVERPRRVIRLTPEFASSDDAPPPSTQRSGRLIDLEPNQCRWPLGNVHDRPPYLFCTEDAVPGKPYCGPHCARAFVGWPR